MEFQSGPNAPLKPVQIIASQEAQLKVMLLLIINGEALSSSWSLQLTDEQGKTKSLVRIHKMR
jgi:hypothetical protein